MVPKYTHRKSSLLPHPLTVSALPRSMDVESVPIVGNSLAWAPVFAFDPDSFFSCSSAFRNHHIWPFILHSVFILLRFDFAQGFEIGKKVVRFAISSLIQCLKRTQKQHNYLL